jgi:UPF0271 protein
MSLFDLNADLGEEMGDDIAILAVVSSANIAGGGHAGGGDVLDAAVAAAVKAGVGIGAHPSYPDRLNFGRKSMLQAMKDNQLQASIVSQVLAVARAAETHGQVLQHVKPHGALYNDAAVSVEAAHLVIRSHLEAAKLLNLTGHLPLMGLPGTVIAQVAEEFDVPFIGEAFADRAYTRDGLLVPRSQEGSVLHDIDAVVAQSPQIADRKSTRRTPVTSQSRMPSSA